MDRTTTPLTTHRTPCALLGIALLALALGAPRAFAQDDDPSPAEQAELIVKLVEELLEKEGEKAGILDGVDPRRAPADVRRMARVLRETKVDVELEKQEFDVVLDLLRKLSGLNIVVSAKAKKALAEDTPEVTLHLKKLSLENIFNLVIAQLGEYRFALRYGAIMLITKDEYRPRRILRVYSISDLIHKPRDFRAPRLGLGGLEDEQREW